MAKKKSKKKPTKPKISTLRRKADRLWKNKVKSVHNGRCAICQALDGTINSKGNPSYINAHHIEDRTNYALRHDILNGIALCPGCHVYNKDSAHKSPIYFHKWLEANRPKVIEHIFSSRNEEIKTNREHYEEIIAKLERPLTKEEADILGIDLDELDGHTDQEGS